MKRGWKFEYKPYGLQGVIHLVLVKTLTGLGFFLRMSKQSGFPKTAGESSVCFVLSCSFFKETKLRYTLYLTSSFSVAAIHMSEASIVSDVYKCTRQEVGTSFFLLCQNTHKTNYVFKCTTQWH